MKLKEALTAAETQETGVRRALAFGSPSLKLRLRQNKCSLRPKSTEMIKRKYIHCGEKDKMILSMNKNNKKKSYKDRSVL